jgi:hypothetical protein
MNRYAGITMYGGYVRHHDSQISPYSWNISRYWVMHMETNNPSYLVAVL